MTPGTVDMTFVDGPKQGEEIRMPNPPPRFLKVAMPEWAVYEVDGMTYRLLYDGITARAWRNPSRPSFL